MEKTGKIGPYRFVAGARPKGTLWEPFLNFVGSVVAFPENLLFKTEEEAFAHATRKAEQLARVPRVTGCHGAVCKKRKKDGDEPAS
jgi:hypothetical protein